MSKIKKDIYYMSLVENVEIDQETKDDLEAEEIAQELYERSEVDSD